MNPYSSFLFARPSFAEGVARSLDLGSTLQEYNASLSSQKADETALYQDWRAVGAGLRTAMKQASQTEEIELDEELLARARAVLASSDQLELRFSDGK